MQAPSFRALVAFVVPLALVAALGVAFAPLLGSAAKAQPGPTSVGDAVDPGPGDPSGTSAPNILLLMIDDLNDYTGSFDGYVGVAGGGHPQASTPHIDRFLRSANTTSFLSAHVPVPACKGVRTAIFSGLSPSTTGVVANASVNMFEDPRFPDYEYMHKYFRNRGYTTFWSGKIEHGTAEFDREVFERLRGQGVPTRDAFNAGFTAWDQAVTWGGFEADFARIAQASGYDIVGDPSRGAALNDFRWGPIDIDERHWADYRTTSAAIEFLQDRRHADDDRPFFLAHGIIKPHKPWFCPKPYFDRIALSSSDVVTHVYLEGDLDDVGPIARRWAYDPNDPEDYTSFIIANGMEARQKMVHAYLACSAFADAQVGRMLDALRTYGFENNTIVVLASDHGYMTGEKNGWGKLILWEDALRVPFGIRVPRAFLNNARPRPQYIFPVSVGAIFATLADLAFGEIPPGDYNSLLPIITSPEGTTVPTEPVLSFYGHVNNVSLRLANYRYTIYRNGFEELYDHTVDPAEHNNMADRPEFQAKRIQACGIVKELVPEVPC